MRILSSSMPQGYLWGFGISYKSSALELPDGTLKLRHCTDLFFPSVFPLGLYLGLVQGLVKGMLLLLVMFWMQVVIVVKGSGLPGRLVQEHLLISFRFQGIQRRGDGKDCAPLPPKEWGVRWASLAIFFLALGLGEVLHQGRLEPASGGNRRRGLPAGQSSRRDWRTGASPF